VNPPAAKAECRSELRARWQRLSDGQRTAGAGLICRRVVEQDFWKQAKTVLLFAPLPDEVHIWPLLETALTEGKILTLPRFDPLKKNYAAAQVADLQRDLVAANFGIREPAAHCGEISLTAIDLALVPGVGFDARGNRLGRGRGFYDRLLADVGGIKCGLALDEQIVEIITIEEQDVRMDVVLTPTQLMIP
jgi:5-formyltetrahydrofolate cyclo-ligase